MPSPSTATAIASRISRDNWRTVLCYFPCASMDPAPVIQLCIEYMNVLTDVMRTNTVSEAAIRVSISVVPLVLRLVFIRFGLQICNESSNRDRPGGVLIDIVHGYGDSAQIEIDLFDED